MTFCQTSVTLDAGSKRSTRSTSSKSFPEFTTWNDWDLWNNWNPLPAVVFGRSL
jgi:hypothetical protein